MKTRSSISVLCLIEFSWQYRSFGQKWCCFGKRFQVKGLFLYIVFANYNLYVDNMTLYGMAGRSISNIYDSKPWGKYTIKVVYIGYRLTSISCYIYYVYTTVSVQQRNLLPKSTSWNGTTFALKSISLIHIRRTTSKIYSWIYFE